MDYRAWYICPFSIPLASDVASFVALQTFRLAIMDFSSSGSVLILVGCLAASLILAKAASAFERYRFAKANGCKEPTKYPQSERIIGYENFKEQMAMSKAKRSLPLGLRRFNETGNTYSIVSLGRKFIITSEPDNVKGILATNFKDFGIGQRLKATGALLGQGIFTSDGALVSKFSEHLHPISERFVGARQGFVPKCHYYYYYFLLTSCVSRRLKWDG